MEDITNKRPRISEIASFDFLSLHLFHKITLALIKDGSLTSWGACLFLLAEGIGFLSVCFLTSKHSSCSVLAFLSASMLMWLGKLK